MNSPAHWRGLLAGMLAMLLTACGFHLRGSLDLPPSLRPVYIDAGNAPALADALGRLLDGHGIERSQGPARAGAVIRLDARRDARILSVDSQGRAREYLLRYRVDVGYRLGQGGEKVYPLSLRRNLVFDPESVLGVSNERDTLYHDMERDAADRILLQLQALAAAGSEPRPQPANGDGAR